MKFRWVWLVARHHTKEAAGKWKCQHSHGKNCDPPTKAGNKFDYTALVNQRLCTTADRKHHRLVALVWIRGLRAYLNDRLAVVIDHAYICPSGIQPP